MLQTNKFILQMTNEQKLFKESLMFFLASWVFVILMKFWVTFWGFTKFLETYGIESLTKSAIGFVMSSR